jgi:hypothetical protein
MGIDSFFSEMPAVIFFSTVFSRDALKLLVDLKDDLDA